MTRLYIVVEGQTEERVIKTILVPHLGACGVWTTPLIVTTSRERGSGKKRKGGNGWGHWRQDIQRILREQAGDDVRVSTLVDLYAIGADFPGAALQPADRDTVARARRLEAAMAAAIGDWRFLPYIQRHELEALVLVDLDPLAALVGAPQGVKDLCADLAGQMPEDVNEGPTTAPSKRLERFVQGYRKTLHGPLVIEQIGLPRLRAACPRFHAWVGALEALGGPASVRGVDGRGG